MLAFASQWSHAAAAILFGALAIWMMQRGRSDRPYLAMAAGAALTAIWALSVSNFGPVSPGSMVSETVRNLGWLGMMYAFWRQGAGEQRAMTVAVLYALLALVGCLMIGLDLYPLKLAESPRLLGLVFLAASTLRMVIAVGALVLVHNLYTAATPETRQAIRFPMIGLSIMWVYELNLYTISYLARYWPMELMALRGIVFALISPLFALALQRTGRVTVRLSRTATFQSLSLVAIGSYLMAMVLASSLIELVADEYARSAQIAFVFGSSVLALALLPSQRFRSWFRVKLAKHMFQHRYDYRAEWVRFADTISKSGGESEVTVSLDARAVQAIADIAEAERGLLLVPDDHGALILQARWNWDALVVPASAGTNELQSFLARTGRVVELDSVRADADAETDEARLVPDWLIAENQAWAIVPLVHFSKLAGAVVLARPKVNRMLDWEDFDLLKVAGRQVASYLAEARGQETLSDVRQFDEFNRRFAFIMHDIKNLVSQLSLLTRNAEKHADNPEFRSDMIATLKSSASRMNDLLARLSQHNKGRAEEPRPIELGPLVEAIAHAKRLAHPIVIGGDLALHAMADPARLEQALAHIVQNAIDASPPTEPISIMVRRIDSEILIETRDRGTGMSAHFIRHDLFKAFASTKDGGFGIGAFEARALIHAMAGRIEVISREGEGTRFNIYLPVTTQSALLEGWDEKVQAA